jgi:hypothetical protein
MKRNIPARICHDSVFVSVLHLEVWHIIKTCVLLRTNVADCCQLKVIASEKSVNVIMTTHLFLMNIQSITRRDNYSNTHTTGIRLHETKSKQLFRGFHSLNGHSESRNAIETT